MHISREHPSGNNVTVLYRLPTSQESRTVKKVGSKSIPGSMLKFGARKATCRQTYRLIAEETQLSIS